MPLRPNLIRIVRVEESRNLPLQPLGQISRRKINATMVAKSIEVCYNDIKHLRRDARPWCVPPSGFVG